MQSTVGAESRLQRGYATAASPLWWTDSHLDWSWKIPSGSFSSGLSGKWPTPSRLPEPCRLRRCSRGQTPITLGLSRGCESNRLLTSTSEVLSLSGRLAGAQEETHKQAVCEQESSFPHFASKREHFSITQENKQKHSSKSVGRLSATVCYKTLCSSAAGLLILTQRCTLFHFSFNLLFLWAARRTPLRFSTLLHRIRWNVVT